MPKILTPQLLAAYLGCKVMIIPPLADVVEYRSLQQELDSISWHGYVSLRKDKGILVVEPGIHIDYIKPILRPISSLTKKEAIETARLVFAHGENIQGLSYGAKKGGSFENVLWTITPFYKSKPEDERLEIFSSRHKIDKELIHTLSVCKVYVPPSGIPAINNISVVVAMRVVNYWRSLYIDTDGLIEAGEAININDLANITTP